MTQIPQYRPGDRTIAELIMRQGDIAARRAEQSGQIWGGTVANLGQIAGQAIQQHQEQKAQQKREALFADAVNSWDPQDPKGSTMRLARVIGPEAIKFGESMMAFDSMVKKNAAGEVPTLDELKTAVVGLRIYHKNAPGEFVKNYPTFRAQFGPAFKAHFGEDLPEQVTPEVEQGLAALADQWGGTGKTREIRLRQPSGGESVQIVEDRPGQTFESAPEPPKAPATTDFNGKRWQFNSATGKYDIELGASEAALGRAAAETSRTSGEEGPAAVQGYVSDLASGNKIWSDVPMKIRNSVEVAARAAGISPPTKRASEKTVNELTDAADLVQRTNDLLSNPVGVQEWAKARGIPNWVTQLTGWGAQAKANRAEFFLYMAETLKSIQGSRPSDKDMEWYMANLPAQGESPQSAQLKIDRIKSRLIRKYNARLRGLQGNGYALPGLQTLDEEGAPDLSDVQVDKQSFFKKHGI